MKKEFEKIAVVIAISIAIIGASATIVFSGSLARKVISGTMGFIMCPDTVEGTEPFSILVEVQNQGNVDSVYEMELSSPHLEILSAPPSQTIAPDRLGPFGFTARAKYSGKPEMTTTLELKLLADGELVDSRSLILKIYMPKIEFTRIEFTPSTEWFGRWWVFKLDLEIANLGQASANDVEVKVAWIEGGVTTDSDEMYIGYLGAGSDYPLTLTLDYDAFDTGKIRIEGRCREGSYHIQETEEFIALPDIGTLKSVIRALAWVVTTVF